MARFSGDRDVYAVCRALFADTAPDCGITHHRYDFLGEHQFSLMDVIIGGAYDESSGLHGLSKAQGRCRVFIGCVWARLSGEHHNLRDVGSLPNRRGWVLPSLCGRC